jgi:lipopolysaccharide transport system ATP-binding protein
VINAEERSHDPSWYDPDLTSNSTVSYETQGATISNPAIFNSSGYQVNHLAVGRRYRISYKLGFEIDAHHLVYGFYFKTVSGVELAGANNLRSKAHVLREANAGDEIEISFDFNCHFMPGTYFLTVGLMRKSQGEYKFMHRIVDALAVHVMEGTNTAINDHGFVALGTGLTVSKIL